MEMTTSGGGGSLSGRRIVVTRSRTQAQELGNLLAREGAEVLYCPAIRVGEPADPRPFVDAVRELDRYEWLILTSANGVQVLFAELERQGRTAPGPHIQVACVGPATAEALRARGVQPAAMPEDFIGSAIAGVLAGRIQPGTRVLLARGAGGSRALPEQLRQLGADLTEVESYRSVPDLENIAELARALDEDAVDLITFTAPSTVSFLVEGLGRLPSGAALAAIGPVTEARMRELGLRAAVVAPEHSMPGLVRAIVQYFAGEPEKERQ
jgi:uroporphyrinogen-III synthase